MHLENTVKSEIALFMKFAKTIFQIPELCSINSTRTGFQTTNPCEAGESCGRGPVYFWNNATQYRGYLCTKTPNPMKDMSVCLVLFLSSILCHIIKWTRHNDVLNIYPRVHNQGFKQVAAALTTIELCTFPILRVHYNHSGHKC